MATIEKRGPWQWRAKIRRLGHPSQTKTFDTKAEAEAWARQLEGDMDRGVFFSRVEAERTTLKEALERYQREVTPTKRGVKQETYRIGQWLRHELAKRSLASIRGADLASWRDEQLKAKLAASTVRNALNTISHLYTIASTEWGMEGLTNPVSSIRKPPMPPGRERRLEEGEEEKLLEACAKSRSPWLVPIVRLAIETGMRLSEILGLDWKLVDLKQQVARIPMTKNGTARDVPLSIAALDLFRSLPRSIKGPVFPVTVDSVKQAYRDSVRRAGLTDLTFHDLRHEATSRFFEKGLDMLEVASITGHKTLVMLKRYTHLRASKLAAKLG